MRVLPSMDPAHVSITANDDAQARCPYSEETLVGCRYYTPRSAHGDFPEAAQCAEAEIVSGPQHIRQAICRRRERHGR